MTILVGVMKQANTNEKSILMAKEKECEDA